ncbi:TPA: type II secretion system protein, partial [Candidatus Galligastranaerophilus faecipullorum]|nr:type II secretion system protein [Candidatus Galligastranaerophilus faecipullorum]
MKNNVQPRIALFKSALSAHFFTYKNKKHTAFTLAELLTAVLVISIIMVALAPVITKRMKDNVSVTTDNKKGLEIFANPGTYTFDVPIGINTLFL